MTTRMLRLDLAFDGTDFVGWQEQARGRSVQGELRRALERFLQHEVQPVGSGRTDAGTHAEGLVAHVTTTSAHDAERFLRALNGLLPPDLSVRRALEVTDDFHARYSAQGKWYRYRLRARRHGLHRRQEWIMPRPVDEGVLQAAADAVVGTHAFRAFCNPHPAPDHHECHVRSAMWSRRGDQLRFDIEGDRFLRHMVRILVGTMIEVGEGKRSLEAFRRLLVEPGQRTDAGPTAPSRGLCLLGVHYAQVHGGPSGRLAHRRAGIEDAGNSC